MNKFTFLLEKEILKILDKSILDAKTENEVILLEKVLLEVLELFKTI